MNLADFSAISNGTYNLGSIRLQGEGEQASLVKINNHRWLANNVQDDPTANARVRQALSDAIRQEGGIPRDVLERLVGDLTSAEHINQPLERRNVRSVLQQIGENRLHDNDVYVRFPGRPNLNAAIAMTALACVPTGRKDQTVVTKMVAAAIKAYDKGNLKVDKNFSTEVRVQVFRTMFKGLELSDMPTDAELRAMTPEEFYTRVSTTDNRINSQLGAGDGDVIFPERSLFSKFRGNMDWDSPEMKSEQEKLSNSICYIFTPGDLHGLTRGVTEFNMKNLPSVKVALESRINGYFANMTTDKADRAAEKKIDKDITSGRLRNDLRFSVDNDDEFVTIEHGNEKSDDYRNWIKKRIDQRATPRQAVTAKLLLTQEALQSFREITNALNLEDYDEHIGFNYYLNKNEDGSLQLEIKKDFTEYGDKNISASFSWRIETNGSATLEDFQIKLPR